MEVNRLDEQSSWNKAEKVAYKRFKFIINLLTEFY